MDASERTEVTLETGQDFFDALPDFAARRKTELLRMLQPVKDVFDLYGALICRATLAAGRRAPRDRQERVVHDLMADVFDFLCEAQRPLFEGRVHVSFPLGRRAYESLSLMSICYQDPEMARRWDEGKRFGNAEIRKKLAKAEYHEPEGALRELYAEYSEGAHPNRSLVSERFLGDGNDFVLGSIGRPELFFVVEECMRQLGLWFWFGAMVGHVCREALRAADREFGRDYFAVAERAKGLQAWLVESFNKLLNERQAELAAEGIK